MPSDFDLPKWFVLVFCNFCCSKLTLATVCDFITDMEVLFTPVDSRRLSQMQI